MLRFVDNEKKLLKHSQLGGPVTIPKIVVDQLLREGGGAGFSKLTLRAKACYYILAPEGDIYKEC